METKKPTPVTSWGATLQLRIKILFSRLGINLRKTCSSNLNFVRSPVLSELHLNEKMTQEKCWEIHQIILSIVKPKIVFVFGDGARDFIISKMKIIEESEPYSLPSRNKEYIAKISLLSLINAKGSNLLDYAEKKPLVIDPNSNLIIVIKKLSKLKSTRIVV